MAKKVVLRTIYAGREMPFARAVIYGNMVYCSGFGGIDPETGRAELGSTKEETVRKQATLTVNKIKNVLREAGTELENIVQALVVVEKLEYWETCLRVFKEMGVPLEEIAQSLIEAKLNRGILLEVQVTAFIPE